MAFSDGLLPIPQCAIVTSRCIKSAKEEVEGWDHTMMEKHLCPLPEGHMVVDVDGWKGDELHPPCPFEVPERSRGDTQNIYKLQSLQLENGK